MNDLFKKPVTIIIIVIAILIAVIWSFWEKRSAEKKAEEQTKQSEEVVAQISNLSNVDPTEFDEAVKEEYALANSKALEADAKNQFSALSVELPGDIAIASGDNRYVFSSPENTANNWTITISQKTGSFLRASIPKDDYLGELKAIDTKLWKFNYVTALQIAEKNGGQAWREKNKADSVSLTMMHAEPNNWLVWSVEYSNSTDKLIIRIDANSGKIIS